METEVTIEPSGKPDESDARHLKPGRRFGVMDVLCIGPIVAHFIYNYAGFPLNALIGTHPVLLSALRASTTSIVTAGAFARVGKASLAAALIAPMPYSVLLDVLYFWAGHRYGRRLFDYLIKNDRRWRKRLARGERFFRRFGVWAVLLAPIAGIDTVISILVGEARMRFVVYLAATLMGNQIAIALIIALGWVIGQPAVDVAQAISKYALFLLLGTLVLAFAWAFYAVWRQQREESG